MCANTPIQALRKRASVIVTVLILMIVSSFLVLITMRYFFAMMWGYVSLTNYYKAYYLARGGMDVLVTQHAYRGRGYETEFSGTANDFNCTAFGTCTLHGTIASHFPRIDASNTPINNQCTRENAILIIPWQSMIFPLFTDTYNWNTYFTPLNTANDYGTFPSIQNIDLSIYDQPGTGMIYLYNSSDGTYGQTTGIQTIPLGSTYLDSQWLPYQIKTNLLATNANKKGLFVIIQNPAGSTPFHFCFAQSKPNENIPMIWQTSTLRADAQVQDSYVTLETIKTNRFPSILLQ